MIITVGGTVSSGKSVVAKHIAGKLNYSYLSPGQILRDMAEEKNMGLNEFSLYAEKNPDIDKEIDSRQKELTLSGDFIVDGRLSAYFLDSSFKIWLTAPLDERARRIMGREPDKFLSIDSAMESIQKREESERKRYKEFYDIDLDDLSIYDLVLNTGKYSINEMKEVVWLASKSLK